MQSIGKTRGGWNTKLHVVSADDKVVAALKLSSGREHGSRSGKELLKDKVAAEIKMPLLMDRAYENDEMRKLARELNYEPIVPPKSNRKTPWDYDRQLYKERNKIERLFMRIKQFRKIFTRYDKLDIMFISFVYFACTMILLR
jgi:transposase